MLTGYLTSQMAMGPLSVMMLGKVISHTQIEIARGHVKANLLILIGLYGVTTLLEFYSNEAEN